MRPARATVDLGDVRIAGGLMLAAAALAPVLPGPDGLPCPLRRLTGVPCPLCGLTTSVTATVHLDPVAAFAASPAGVVAVVLAVVLLLSPGRRQASVPRWAPPAALAVMWIWQLARFDIL